MTLGDKATVYSASWRGVPLRDLFARAGTAHLLAVSGGNVTVLAAVVCWLCWRLGMSRRSTLLPALVVVGVYTLMTGLPASAVRAGIMNAVGLVVWAYRPKPIESAFTLGLGLSGLVILALDPEELFRPGFQLSFAAVTVLVLGSWRVDAALQSLPGGTLCALALWLLGLFGTAATAFPWLASPAGKVYAVGTLAVAAGFGRSWDRLPLGRRWVWSRLPAGLRFFLSAQLAILLGLNLPMSGYYFGIFSVAGLAVNLLAIPIAAVITPAALLAGLLGMIPWVGAWLAKPVGWLMTGLTSVLLDTSYLGARWLGCPSVVAPSLGGVVAYLVVLGGFLWVVGRKQE